MALFGLTQKIGRFVAWNKLGVRLGALQDAWTKFQEANPMTWKEAALNAAKHAAYSLGSVLGAAALAWLAGPDAAGIITKDMSPTIAVAAVPLLHMGAVALQNALKVATK